MIFLLYLFGSIVLFISITGIPFGIRTLKMAMLSLSLFGKEVSHGERAEGCLYIVVNIIWVLVANRISDCTFDIGSLVRNHNYRATFRSATHQTSYDRISAIWCRHQRN